MSEAVAIPRPFAERDPDLSGRSVLIVGLGRSGLAAARLAAAKGARLIVTDARSEDALASVQPRKVLVYG